MKKLTTFVSLIFALSVQSILGQASKIEKTDLSQAEIDRIVKTFTTNEGRFREALNVYAFDRSATIGTIGLGGQITGVYRRDSFLTFNNDGQRFEKITFFPVSTLTEIDVTLEDIEDLGGVNPFALEPRNVTHYKFTYLGKEKIDELNLHVFDVEPKVVPDPKKSKLRLFNGRVWVDDRDLMIVKSKGKAVPEDKNNKYPTVETWRENVDGKYWFPSFSTSDDELVFDNGNVVKMKVRVKYTNYRVGRTDVTIVGEENVPTEPSPTPKKP
ncbi:MAG: hypothetical protein ACRD6X_14700 [Pyrinomonadaceae bacterium]